MVVYGAMKTGLKRALGVGLSALGFLVLFTCKSSSSATTLPTPAAQPASALVDHEGDSTDTAVVVPKDAPDEARFENDWIFDRIGRFRRVSQGTGTLNGRRYDVIDVETPAGDKRKFYFDMTEHWNNWKPPSS